MKKILLLSTALLLTALSFSQNNSDLSLTQPERDSILKDYNNIFPIWGRKAIEKGFDIPKPFGVNVNYLYMRQDIEIYDMQLGINNNGLVPVDFIKFGAADSKVSTFNTRLDLWVLPFLNVYGMFGTINTSTAVSIEEPVSFESGSDFSGTFYGLGTNFAFGVKKYFVIADVNFTWSNLDKLDQPARGRVFSMRMGKSFDLGKKNMRGETKKISFWAGTMNQALLNTTTGNVNLKDVMPGDKYQDLLEFQASPEYDDLNKRQQILVDRMIKAGSNLEDASIQYSLNKNPLHKWNLLLGSQFEFNKSWQLRTEVGVINRFSVLVNLNYRLGF
jgi:hypothetical protein